MGPFPSHFFLKSILVLADCLATTSFSLSFFLKSVFALADCLASSSTFLFLCLEILSCYAFSSCKTGSMHDGFSFYFCILPDIVQPSWNVSSLHFYAVVNNAGLQNISSKAQIFSFIFPDNQNFSTVLLFLLY